MISRMLEVAGDNFGTLVQGISPLPASILPHWYVTP